ncbi:hypothetical protein [Streptomyces sp. DSM 118878]
MYVNALAKGGPGVPGLVTDAQARGRREVTDAVHTEGGTVFGPARVRAQASLRIRSCRDGAVGLRGDRLERVS